MTESTSPTGPLPAELADHTPGARLVYLTLVHISPATNKQLATETYLDPRTVWSALEDLHEADLIIQRPNYLDLRQDYYSTADSPGGGDTPDS